MCSVYPCKVFACYSQAVCHVALLTAVGDAAILERGVLPSFVPKTESAGHRWACDRLCKQIFPFHLFTQKGFYHVGLDYWPLGVGCPV